MSLKKQKEKTEEKIPSTPMQFMRFVSHPHRRWLFAALSAIFIAEMIVTGIPYLFRSVIDTAQAVLEGKATYHDVWMWALAYPAAVAIMFAAWRTSGFMGMQWVSRSSASSYQMLFAYLGQHSHAYFSNRFAGSLSSKISHASEGVQSLFESFLWNYFPSVLSLSMTLLYIWGSSREAALVFFLLIVTLIPVNIRLARARRPHVVQFSAQATKARGYAVDAITNMAAIRQYARHAEERHEFNRQIEEMRVLNVKQWSMSEWGLVANNAIIVIFETAILLIAVQFWIAGKMTIGELVMITALMLNIQGTLVFIGNSINGFVRRFGEIQEGLADILVSHEILDRENARDLMLSAGKIECRDVTFEYESGTVFSGLNLIVEPGERVGLVGSSGAGKSTLVSLLLRQHDLKQGAIFLDDQDISMVTQRSLREHIAVVPQEPLLFHRSIRDNIAYGKLGASDEEIRLVAEKAQAHSFINTLPEGYNTLVGERGVKLSGGQKQRIAIARAMLKNAPILILDEATSALDSESEVAIQKALHELMEGKTVIAIAHRLSTLREMDRIIVLETGKIMESGSHEELVRQGGTYARLWEHQAGGFLLPGHLGADALVAA